MASKKALCLLLVVSLSLIIENTDAISFKFWKKKKDEEPTTASTIVTESTSTSTTPTSIINPQPGSKPGNTNKAIAGAADPGLAIGIGNSGTNVRNNPRPQRPNPGTEVGLDFPSSKPSKPGIGGNSGQGYRDWALDLTGAGEPQRPAPTLPSRGPALSPGGSPLPSGKPGLPANNQQPSSPGSPTNQKPALPVQPGSPTNQKPASPIQPGSQNGQRPTSPALSPNQPIPSQPSQTPKPGSPQPVPNQPGQLTRPQNPQQNPLNPNSGKPQVSTLNIGPLTPTGNNHRDHPASPSSPSGTGGKTWAEVAGGGSKPSSPTPRPISGGLTPGQIGSGANVGGAAASNKRIYSTEPTYSKGNQVTNEDLEKLSESLFTKDSNNAFRHIRMNLQKQTTGSSPKDEAPEPLFTVNSQAFQIPTIEKVLTIYDNYKLDSRVNEYISPAQRNEESLLVDTFLSTNVMSAAMRFLADKGYIAKDYYAYKDKLRQLWFNLYSRGEGKIGSSGFEHVFLTELKLGTEVSGLHNWIYFNAEEVKKRADYLGYMRKLDLGDKAAILKIHSKFENIDKPVTTMFVGTSPELEMALYTVCFMVRSNQKCPVSLGGAKFDIVTHPFKYRGKDLIGSAYPDI